MGIEIRLSFTTPEYLVSGLLDRQRCNRFICLASMLFWGSRGSC
jgi:hypothetical protein